MNARTITRNTRRRGRVEVWWWMYLDDSDLYYRLLGTGIRELLKSYPQIAQIFLCNLWMGFHLPTDHELLRLFPNRQIRTYSTAMQMIGCVE